jgi:hypothetical protein
MTKSEKSKSKRLWTLYRITLDEQRQIENFQLRTHPYYLLMGSRLGTDHDHANGLIRGRIDFRLNRALGLIEGAGGVLAPDILRALAHYLEHPPAVLAIGKKFGLIGQAKVKRKMVYGSENGPVEVKKRRKRK